MAELHINNKKQYFWSPEEDAVILDVYAKGGYDAVEYLLPSRSKSAIQQRALKLGVKYLNYDPSYFESIDSHEKAYWLGFLYADGYVTSGDRWGLELTASDKEHIQNLLNAFRCNIKIKNRNRNGYKSCGFQIKNRRMYDSLQNAGVVKNKTYILNFPSQEIVDGIFHADFIRGFFDGDGCVSFSTASYIRPERKGKEYTCLRKQVSLVCKSETFLKKICEILYENNIYLHWYLNKRDNLFVIQSRNGDEICKLFEYLYSDSEPNVRLERKFQKMRELVDKIGGGQNGT